MTLTKLPQTLRAALAAALLLALACPRPATALIDPDYTPVQLYRNVTTIAQLQVGTLGDADQFTPQVIETIKGQLPAELTFDLTATPDNVREDLEDQLSEEGTPAVLFLSNIGYNALQADMTDVAGAVLVGGKWFVLRAKDAHTFGLDGDTLNLRNVWAGSALMLARCLAYITADPAASVPVSSGMKWTGERQLGNVEGKVTGAYAVDLFGDGKPCLLVTALSGDRLFRVGKEGALAEITAAAALTSASRYVTFGDFTGDGRLDILAWDGGRLTLATQSAAGTFTCTPLPVQLPATCLGLSTVDGGDGHPGVLAATEAGPILVRRDGQGAWGANGIGEAPDAGKLGAAGVCVAADLDGDGIVDVLQLFARGLRFHRGTATGAFAPPVETAAVLLPGLSSPMVGDYDADGLLDVLAVGQGGVVALRNLGQGRFTEQLSDSGEMSYDHYNECSAGAVCDINSDGRQECFLLFPDYYPQFFFNRGFFTTGVANDMLVGSAGGAHGAGGGITLTAAPELGQGQQAGVAADFDGDGAEEVVLVAANGAIWLLTAGSDTPRMSLSATLPTSAAGPLVVTGYDGPRCLGARLLAPGGIVRFGKGNKGPLRLQWHGTDGHTVTKTPVVMRSMRVQVGEG